MIRNTIEYFFIFIAVGMFGAGGIFGVYLTDGNNIIALPFGVLAIIGVIALAVNFKNLGIAEKKLKEFEA